MLEECQTVTEQFIYTYMYIKVSKFTLFIKVKFTI